MTVLLFWVLEQKGWCFVLVIRSQRGVGFGWWFFEGEFGSCILGVGILLYIHVKNPVTDLTIRLWNPILEGNLLNCFEKSFSIRMNCTMKAYRPFLKFACNYDVWIWTAHSCIYLGFEFADVPAVCGFICCWEIQISSSVVDVVLTLLGLCIVWINFVQNCTNWTMISVQEWPNEKFTPPHMRAALVGCGNLFLNILV